jgi:hypothetical protein
MALSILDGNQSATTLSTILSSGQHITAHTVISLGTQAIADIVNATSANLTNTQLRASAVTVGGTVTVGNSLTISSLPAISGTVTANIFGRNIDGTGNILQIPIIAYDQDITSASDQYVVPVQISTLNGSVGTSTPLPISGTVTVGNTVTIAGTVTANPTGTQTIAGSVTLGAGTAQIGSVTASISGTVPISISSVTVGNTVAVKTDLDVNSGLPCVAVAFDSIGGVQRVGTTNAFPIRPMQDGAGNTIPLAISGTVTIGSLPSLVAGTAQIGSVTASISNTAITVYSAQGTTVTNSNFTSTTASTTLVSAVAGRDVLTVFNEGAGNLFISPGATATTISYQVRLSAGDYWECPEGQRSLIHTAVFATAGTARVTEVS